MRGRVIWDNVVELDTYLRMYAMVPANYPAAVLLGQAKAFTALDQTFMFLVLARAGTPRVVLRLLRRLYEQKPCLCRWGNPAGFHQSDAWDQTGVPSKCEHLGDLL